MALQDLTPQLRTRLSRMERAVGWFVVLAVVLLAVGFIYYVYDTAERKGWFKTKAPYFTFTERATGLKVGDPVQLMGFNVGEITRIEGQKPYDQYNVYVEFSIQAPYYGYLWTSGSRVKVNAAGLLDQRVLEVTKGTSGYPTYIFYPLREVSMAEARGLAASPAWKLGQEVADATLTNLLARALTPLTNLAAIAASGCTNLVVVDTSQERKFMTGIWNDKQGAYEPYVRGRTPYWLVSDESPPVTERLEELVGQIELALPNILGLTNQLARILSNSTELTSNLNVVALTARPAVSNLAAATAELNRPGALGEWLLPTNLNRQLETTLGSANATLATANTNLAVLAENLNRSLENLADITSNLNNQVAANTNLVRAVSDTIIHADQFIQGLKHHWLLRSAFKNEKTGPSPPASPLLSPKQSGQE